MSLEFVWFYVLGQDYGGMSTQTTSSGLDTLKWVSRKLVSLFIVYVAAGSFFKSVQGDSTVSALLYVLLGMLGFYVAVNW